jgi:putative phosphoribosyl transferase
MNKYRDRQEAGRHLAVELAEWAGEAPIVLALPRGGVPVGLEVARALRAPLDVRVVRKVGVPWNPEYGMGAVAEGGQVFLDQELIARVGASAQEVEAAVARAGSEVETRLAELRGARPRLEVAGRTVILVDDGLATGGTARAAARSIRGEGPGHLILAVPVAAPDALAELAGEVDEVVCPLRPPDLRAIALWYEEFGQVSDAEVRRMLAAS